MPTRRPWTGWKWNRIWQANYFPNMSTKPSELSVLLAAVKALTPAQLDEYQAGRLTVSPGIAEVLASQGIHPPQPATPPPYAIGDAWLKSQDAYDDARAVAEAAGASPANLNALLQPGEQRLPCGLTMRPMVLSGYVFLEAVSSPFVVGGRQPTPADLLFLAMALTIPERVSALIRFDDDFAPVVADPEALRTLSCEYGGRVGAADVALLTAHAQAQFALMFPRQPAAESEGADPLGEAEAARAA